MKNKLLKKTFWNFILKVTIWTIIIGAIVIVIKAYIENSNFQWVYDKYPESYLSFKQLYRSQQGAKIACMILFIIWLLGLMIIIYRLLKKVFGYVNAISNASNDMLNKDIGYIKLPLELEDIEKRMNELKNTAIKNEKKAQESEQRKNDLITYLAHDLKTPLTSTIGYLSLLDEVKDMPIKQREKYIKIALDKSYRLEDLLNELFEITKFNSEKIIIEKEKIDLNLMIEQIIDDFYPMLIENNKKIVFNCKEKIDLLADPDKLARVFSNLIKNAIYYSIDELINIDIRRLDKSVQITISNKGKKISEDKLNKLFEKFYRADSSRTSKTGGSGLGLAIAKEIVELHGGSITASSDDEYTKFIIKLLL